VSEEQTSSAQHTLALLRWMDAKLDGVSVRPSVPERRGALKDEEALLDGIAAVGLRQRVERLERRLDLVDSPLPPAA
jgi:hypothetical protein